MRRIVSFLGAFCLLFGVTSQAHAIATHELSVTPASAYIEYANMFPSVGWVFAQENGLDVASASGTLIDPQWVITAAHLVLSDDNDPTSLYDTFDFGLGTNTATDPGESQFASEVFVNPGYIGPENGPDMALLYFENGFQSADPAQIYIGSNAALLGTDASIVGFGAPGTPATGLQAPDGQKRAGINVVTLVNSPVGYQETIFRNTFDPDFRTLGVLGTPGDSGGGWFIQDGDDFYLTAISSFGDTNIRYGSGIFASLVNPELQWINDTIASKAVPEPSSALLLLVGAPFLRRMRRRAA